MKDKFKNIDEMKIDEVIEEINALYKKSQEVGLTEEEKERQQIVRKRYIDNVKKNFKAQIGGYKMVDKNQSNSKRYN